MIVSSSRPAAGNNHYDSDPEVPVSDLVLAVAADPARLALACVAAFGASILGGLAGYGTGLVLPVFLVPLVGVVNVVPVMAVAMLFNNGSRVVAFRREIDRVHAWRVLVLGLPAVLVGAWGYTRLPERGVALLIGSFLLAMVAWRRLRQGVPARMPPGAEVAAGGAFGLVNGVVPGAGVLLISILMGSGVTGAALIATDAIASLALGVTKVALFGTLDALDARLTLTGLLVGACTVPGAFVARALLARIPGRVHAAFMEVVIVAGAITILVRAW